MPLCLVNAIRTHRWPAGPCLVATHPRKIVPLQISSYVDAIEGNFFLSHRLHAREVIFAAIYWEKMNLTNSLTTIKENKAIRQYNTKLWIASRNGHQVTPRVSPSTLFIECNGLKKKNISDIKTWYKLLQTYGKEKASGIDECELTDRCTEELSDVRTDGYTLRRSCIIY